MNVQTILRRHGIRPSKGLGQNLLTDMMVLEDIVEASALSPDDIVLEVGPGLGLLTARLAEQAGHVVAVELDKRMIPVLQETLVDHSNAHVIEGDILKTDPAEVLREIPGWDGRFKVVANLPYYITSAVLAHLLGGKTRPRMLTVMVQKEVADRIVAQAGQLSLLAISIQVYGAPKRVCRVPARAFYPRPKVDSAVLHIDVYDRPLVPEEELPAFFRVARAAYGQKRKQIHNSLTHNLHIKREEVLAALSAAGIASDRRPQTLTIDEWARLTGALFSPTPPETPQ